MRTQGVLFGFDSLVSDFGLSYEFFFLVKRVYVNSSKDFVLLFHLLNLETCKLKVLVFISMFIVGIKELRFYIFV